MIIFLFRVFGDMSGMCVFTSSENLRFLFGKDRSQLLGSRCLCLTAYLGNGKPVKLRRRAAAHTGEPLSHKEFEYGVADKGKRERAQLFWVAAGTENLFQPTAPYSTKSNSSP